MRKRPLNQDEIKTLITACQDQAMESALEWWRAASDDEKSILSQMINHHYSCPWMELMSGLAAVGFRAVALEAKRRMDEEFGDSSGKEI